MFKDKRFKVKYSVDKRGRPTDTSTSENLKKYYELSSDDAESDVSEEELQTEKPSQKILPSNSKVSKTKHCKDITDTSAKKETGENSCVKGKEMIGKRNLLGKSFEKRTKGKDVECKGSNSESSTGLENNSESDSEDKEDIFEDDQDDDNDSARNQDSSDDSEGDTDGESDSAENTEEQSDSDKGTDSEDEGIGLLLVCFLWHCS